MGLATLPVTVEFSIDASVSSFVVVTEAAPTTDTLVLLPLDRLAEIPVATAVRSPDLMACTFKLVAVSAKSVTLLSTMRAVVSSSDFCKATAPAMAALKVVDAFLDMASAPPPATLTWVRSDSARTVKPRVPAPSALITARSTSAVVSRSVVLVTIAPAPAMAKLGGLLAAGSLAAALSEPEPLAGSLASATGAMLASLPSSWAWVSAESVAVLSARFSPVLLGAAGGFSPAVAPATPMATIFPSVRASTRMAPATMAPTVPSVVSAPPESASLSPT